MATVNVPAIVAVPIVLILYAAFVGVVTWLSERGNDPTQPDPQRARGGVK